VTYNTLLSVCAAVDDAPVLWTEVECVLREMRAAGVSPDTLSYGTAMRSLALAGQLEGGWALYGLSKAARLVPCTTVLVHALSLARRSDNWDWTLQARAFCPSPARLSLNPDRNPPSLPPVLATSPPFNPHHVRLGCAWVGVSGQSSGLRESIHPQVTLSTH
jgi:hypothetical protein